MICIGLLVALILPDSPLRNPLKKIIISENVIFRGLRLSLGHFGQQAPESHVSQLQNGVSTSSLSHFIVDLLTFKDYLKSNSFFPIGILEGVKWKTSQAYYNGSKQQCYKHISVSFLSNTNSLFLFVGGTNI